MTRSIVTLAAVWALLGAGGVLVAQDATERELHLVYHSDTRGYYRPCG